MFDGDVQCMVCKFDNKPFLSSVIKRHSTATLPLLIVHWDTHFLKLRNNLACLAQFIRLFRACLFGLSVAGCVGKAAVQEKLLCRESRCSEFCCLATWLPD
jgi:hypothetical protein